MEITNFAIISGTSASVDKGKITYKADDTEDSPQVIIRSDSSFSNGTLEFTLKATSYKTAVLFKPRAVDNKSIRIGYSRTSETFTIGVFNGIWKSASKAGSLLNYNLKDPIVFKISVEGSLITMYINNVLICEANLSIKEAPIEFLLSSDADFTLENFKIKKISPKLFIVMQFSKDYNELYEEVIKPVSEKFGYECVRADEFYTSTPIISDIITSIKEATAIIAEITPDNPNVFYEIGYSHAINKPTILLCDKKREKLPFDLSSFRTLYYENTIAGKKKVEASLTKYLEKI